MKLFDKNSDISIVLSPNADEAIVLAAKDLQRDLRRLSGKKNGFPITTSASAPIICIQPTHEGTAEAYSVKVTDLGVSITGSDILGTVYGIYAFSTNYLNILPVYRLTDIFPDVCAELEIDNKTVTSKTRQIKFRGWFINDEDLLCDFRDGGGRRDLDYGYYQQVLHPDVLDMVLETALRMEINLVIPGSLADIDNPAEAEMIAAVVRRGLYVSTHHIEPVGASFFAIENYLKKRGRSNENLSIISNPGLFEEVWKYYIDKWAKYGKRVVWQIGLRGKGDRAVWKGDPNFTDDSEAARGAIVSKAINTQHRLISEALGTTDFPSTITMWSEMSGLYGSGVLDLPEGSTIVLSDTGHTQMFTENFYSAPRYPKWNYGIYYHTSFWYEGPHLAEGCDLRKMTFSYNEARKMDSLSYSMVNISNLRPVHFSVWFNSQLMNNPNEFDMDVTLKSMLNSLYGNDAAALEPMHKEYYECFAAMQIEDLLYRYSRLNVTRHDYGKLNFPEYPATDGYLRHAGIKMKQGMYLAKDHALFLQTIRTSMEKWKDLYNKLCVLEPSLSAKSQEYIRKFLKFETYYMMQLSKWVLEISTILYDRDDNKRKESLSRAVNILSDILETRKVLEQGHWAGWHNGDRKIGIADLIILSEAAYREGIVTPPPKKHAAF